MKNITSIIASGLVFISGSAAYAGEKVMYQEITDNKPEVGVSATVYLGDRMLEQRRGQYQECIVPKFDSNKSVNLGMANVIIKNGVPICKSTANSKNYTSPYVNWTPDFRYDFALKQGKNDELNLCVTQMGVKAGCTKGKLKSDYDSNPYFVYSSNSFQQTIEYAGRNGDNLKFIYSEFSDGFARQAFTREFQVDLSQGSVAAYKGAVIEIESATNSSITYKVVRNFQQ
jgi:hypothetical protein